MCASDLVCMYVGFDLIVIPTPTHPPTPTITPQTPKVMRVWFDRQLSGRNGTIDILETPDFEPVNLIAQYHLLEAECAAWANKTGGASRFRCGGGVGDGCGGRGDRWFVYSVSITENDTIM